MNIRTKVSRVRELYFWSISAIYLFAFSSIYYQIQGLYGDDGVLPVRAFAQLDKRGLSALITAFSQVPSLVWLGPSIGLSLNTTLDLISLFGILISFLQLLWPGLRTTAFYAIQFVLYFSLYQIGQTFMWFQWDILMLEVGFLTAIAAPLDVPFLPKKSPHDSVTFWLIRWLMFRLMFASGVVKLTSGCPAWWGLSALNIHFESQCIPTPLSWYAHHLPDWLLRWFVVATYVIEIAIPFLFFIPIGNLRLFAFWSQIFFQLAIILTGNYNFFNLLTCAICLSVLNDSHIQKRLTYGRKVKMLKIIEVLVSFIIYSSLIYWTVYLFDIKFANQEVKSKIVFNKEQFNEFLRIAIPLSIAIGSTSLLFNIISAIYNCFKLSTNHFNKVKHLLLTLVFSSISIFMFSISLVPHTSLEPTQSNTLWPVIKRWHRSTDGFQLVNSYGLFRRMTGLNGRPELVIEGANDLKGEWREYHFKYKPGDVSQAPKFIIPHQPRLDWQMWFAALDHYQNNPWLLHLAYRLLNGQKEVIELLDEKRIPFKKPPIYIRARLYTYRYTGFNAKNWWRKSDVKDYMQPVTRESLKDYLIQNGIEPVKKVQLKDDFPNLASSLKWFRQIVMRFEPNIFIYSLLTTAIVVGRV